MKNKINNVQSRIFKTSETRFKTVHRTCSQNFAFFFFYLTFNMDYNVTRLSQINQQNHVNTKVAQNADSKQNKKKQRHFTWPFGGTFYITTAYKVTQVRQTDRSFLKRTIYIVQFISSYKLFSVLFMIAGVAVSTIYVLCNIPNWSNSHWNNNNNVSLTSDTTTIANFKQFPLHILCYTGRQLRKSCVIEFTLLVSSLTV